MTIIAIDDAPLHMLSEPDRLEGATLHAPFKINGNLSIGSGNLTFTRSTVKRHYNNEGVWKDVKSGALTFGGARCVQNFCTGASEDLTNAGWTKTALTATNASTLKCANSTSVQLASNISTGGITVNGQKWLAHYRLQYVDIQYIQILGGSPPFGTGAAGEFCNFDLINGDYTATNCTATMAAVSAGVWDISILFTAVNSDGATLGRPFLALVNAQNSTRLSSFTGDGIKTVKVLRYQFENVTGQADQTMSEYVSMGVESSPAYHGAYADGVKYYATNKDGSAIYESRFDGINIDFESKTNNMLHCRDMTNAVWVKTNVTAVLTQTGIDGLTNACTLLTATAANGTSLQTITAAAAAGCSGFWVKRYSGDGPIYITRDNGSTWTDISSQLNLRSFSVVKIENTSVTNPVVGFKIGTSGDSIIIDSGLNHLGAVLCEPIFTTTAASTRSAEVATYQTSGNISNTEGSIVCTHRPTHTTWSAGSLIGSDTNGLFVSTTTSGVQAKDGTSTANGADGTPDGQMVVGMTWGSDGLVALNGNDFGESVSYDGNLNLSTIGVSPGKSGYVRNLIIYPNAITLY